MKFLISSSKLYKQLVALHGAVVSNPLIPILENFLFEVKKNQLYITASDLQTSIVTNLDLEVEGETAIAVPAKILLDTIKNLPEQILSFYIDEGAYSIMIKSDNGQYTLAGENAQDFPIIPQPPVGESSIFLPANTLKRAIQQTIIATSHDDLKPALNGVYMKFDEEKFTFVATDIHRLIKYTKTLMGLAAYTPFILPRKSLVLLNNLLSTDEQQRVQFIVKDDNVHFQLGNIHMIVKMINERYPEYENVIPTNNPHKLTISRMALLASLKRILIYTNKVTYQLKFTLQENNLVILAEDFNFDNKAKEQLPCIYEGRIDLEIGFSAKSLIELLQNMHSEEVDFYFSDINKATVIMPTEQEKDEDLLLLIMPITIY